MVAKNTLATTTSPEKDKDKSLLDKIIVTNLNDMNQLVMFSNSILDDFCFETLFGELNVEPSPNMNSYMQSELLHST